MVTWIDLGRVGATLNVLLLLGLTGVWIRTFRRHGVPHTLALVVFGGFLLAENAVWIFPYVFHAGYGERLAQAGTDVQVASLLLCGLELFALTFPGWITWR